MPEYMVPSAFVVLDQWPLSANDKIDRKALPALEAALLSDDYVAPACDIEQQLVLIWAQLLDLDADKLSVTANFFELGGHSLLITRMLHQVVEQFDVHLSVKSVFQGPSIRVMAESLVQMANTKKTVLTHVDSDGSPQVLSYSQYRVWFVEQLKDNTNEHNMPCAMNIKGALNVQAFEAALQYLVNRHEILRTRFVVVDGEPVQIVEPSFEFKLKYDDSLVGDSGESHDTQIFKLDTLPLLSCLLIKRSENDFLLRINQHHIISDGWSHQLFFEELGQVYQAICIGGTPQLSDLPFTYSDYARWQSAWLKSKDAELQLNFWQDYLEGCNELLTLPIQSSTVLESDSPQGHVDAVLEAAVGRQLKTIAQQHKGSLFNVLQSAFALLLARLSGQHDLTIGIPVTGRHIYGTQNMLGMFLNNLPVRHQVDLQANFGDYLSGQIDNMVQVLSNQDMPLERILELVDSAGSTDNTPLFQVLFNMLSLPGADASEGEVGLDITNTQTADIQSKFDLTLYVTDAADGVEFHCSYNKDKFTHQSMTTVMAQYVSLLNQIAENIELPCGHFSLTEGSPAHDQMPVYWPGGVTDLFSQLAVDSGCSIKSSMACSWLPLRKIC